MKRDDYVRLQIEISKNQNEKLTEHTKKNGQTKVGAIRVAIDKYLERSETK